LFNKPKAAFTSGQVLVLVPVWAREHRHSQEFVLGGPDNRGAFEIEQRRGGRESLDDGCLGEHRKLPQQGPGHSPGRKRVLEYIGLN